MVVAGHEQHAAVGRGAGMTHVLEDIPAPVDAGCLAIPKREHSIDTRLACQVYLLRAPDRRRGEFLVDSRQELHVVGLQFLLRAPESLVESAERRAAIAADESRRRQPALRVAPALHKQQADQCLDAAEVHVARTRTILVVERDAAKVGVHVGSTCQRSSASITS